MAETQYQVWSMEKTKNGSTAPSPLTVTRRPAGPCGSPGE